MEDVEESCAAGMARRSKIGVFEGTKANPAYMHSLNITPHSLNITPKYPPTAATRHEFLVGLPPPCSRAKSYPRPLMRG